MKPIYFVIALIISTSLFSQSDQVKKQEVAIPLGTKFSLKLTTKDSVHFSYEVINFKQVKKIIVLSEVEKLFSKPKKGIIEGFFIICKPEENSDYTEFESALLLRNNINMKLSYKANILVKNSKKFESTSVRPLYPGVRVMEIWPYKVELIHLHDFIAIKSK